MVSFAALAEAELHATLAGDSGAIADDRRVRERVGFLLGGVCAPVAEPRSQPGPGRTREPIQDLIENPIHAPT